MNKLFVFLVAVVSSFSMLSATTFTVTTTADAGPGSLRQAIVDANGTEIRANDNWKSDQQAELEAIGIQPSDDRESALIARLTPGNYTAVVRGTAEGTGVGLVEVYNLQ